MPNFEEVVGSVDNLMGVKAVFGRAFRTIDVFRIAR